MTFRSIFRGKKDKLEKMIDFEHGLLSKLVDYNVITMTHRTAIKVTFVTVDKFYACIVLR